MEFCCKSLKLCLSWSTLYTDADWVACSDDKRSTGGWCIFLGNSLISYSFGKHRIVSRSSTEVEFRSLALTMIELLCIKKLLSELNVESHCTPILLSDNQGVGALVKHLVFHSRTNYVEIDFHFIRERILNGKVFIEYIYSQEQLAYKVPRFY